MKLNEALAAQVKEEKRPLHVGHISLFGDDIFYWNLI